MKPVTNNGDDRVLVVLDLRNVSTFLNAYTDRSQNDYRMLLDGALMGRRLADAIAFDSLIYEDNEDSCRGFHNKIRASGFRVQLITATNKAGKQGVVDVGMALYVCEYVNKADVDVVELITGDGDLVPLVEMLQKNGIRVNVSAFRECMSSALKDCANTVRYLDTVPMLKMGTPSGGEKESGSAAESTPEVAA